MWLSIKTDQNKGTLVCLTYASQMNFGELAQILLSYSDYGRMAREL